MPAMWMEIFNLTPIAYLARTHARRYKDGAHRRAQARHQAKPGGRCRAEESIENLYRRGRQVWKAQESETSIAERRRQG